MQIKKYTTLALLLTLSISLSSCMDKKTEDPAKAYKLWAGEKAPKEVQVIHGKYWQSAHWTKEYIVYLELQTSAVWTKEFIRQNSLMPSMEPTDVPPGFPAWFLPDKHFKRYVPSDLSKESSYFIDTVSWKMFLYEMQL